ncbi:P-loop containing nucleoside triphosphate hydrolase protein [Boeremia exigua]|uniref:P-loop containing nucleoside triphosphate hydrolase protein n=1 Tax=Boeremia exigua TaxID=749465 RepID=UPI001E8DBCDE|nr:P-loop containing nucleoside triphosphate hydrolase protein [Boeremia exigua]KAH6639507.1 P-loop containing nucleoside triphosphate hydrolase protein [Boeremia exigua]
MLDISSGVQGDGVKVDTLEVIQPEDIIIAILGATGAGKSSFIENCTKDRRPCIGHELTSCTTQVSVHTMEMLGRTVHLIDTPGFNDTLRSDGETFQELAYWLAAADERKFKLSGIVFLHRITDIRFHSSTRRALEIFKAICGKGAFCGTVVATTMWNRVATGEIEKAQDRQIQLKTKIQDDILAFGGRLVPISAAEVDPCNIVRHIVLKDMRLDLAFQKELRQHDRLLHQTTAGKIVYESLLSPSDAMRASMHSSAREMAAAINSLRATRAEVQIAWEKRIQKENEDFQQLTQRYRDYTRLIDQSVMASETPSIGERRDVSNTDLEFEFEKLKREHEAVMFRQGSKLDRRIYRSKGRGTTTLGVVGTGLAVGQLVAAVACNVM